MLRPLWEHHKPALIVFVAACLVALFFAVRLAMFSAYWSDPARRDAAIEGWQTPGYVAMSWKVPKPVIAEALGLEAEERSRRSLADIAVARGVPLDEVIGDLRAAIDAFRADRP